MVFGLGHRFPVGAGAVRPSLDQRQGRHPAYSAKENPERKETMK
jgi:hypothetical protein